MAPSGMCPVLDYDVDAVYRPLQNQFFNQLMLDIRSRFGPFPGADAAIAAGADITPASGQDHRDGSRSGTSSGNGALADLSEPGHALFMGAAKIAMRTGYPVLFTWMRRVRRGYYEVEMAPVCGPALPSDAVEKITGHYAATVESIIRQRPAEWLWSHKRWKHRR